MKKVPWLNSRRRVTINRLLLTQQQAPGHLIQPWSKTCTQLCEWINAQIGSAPLECKWQRLIVRNKSSPPKRLSVWLNRVSSWVAESIASKRISERLKFRSISEARFRTMTHPKLSSTKKWIVAACVRIIWTKHSLSFLQLRIRTKKAVRKQTLCRSKMLWSTSSIELARKAFNTNSLNSIYGPQMISLPCSKRSSAMTFCLVGLQTQNQVENRWNKSNSTGTVYLLKTWNQRKEPLNSCRNNHSSTISAHQCSKPHANSHNNQTWACCNSSSSRRASTHQWQACACHPSWLEAKASSGAPRTLVSVALFITWRIVSALQRREHSIRPNQPSKSACWTRLRAWWKRMSKKSIKSTVWLIK